MVEHIKIFDDLADRSRLSFKRFGITKPRSLSPSAFSSFSEERRSEVLQIFHERLKCLEFLTPHMSEFEHLEAILNFYGLKMQSEGIGSEMKTAVCWEVIDFNVNQLFRNLLIYRTVTYSIDELEAFSPWELYSRPMSVLEGLSEVMAKLWQTRDTVWMHDFPEYVMEERMSSQKQKFLMKHTSAWPLFDQECGELKAFVAFFTMTPVKDSDQKVVVFR